ncbi:CbiX/SirB N-terminal domain-containing protein [Enterococcus asini]|uniref:sirohydrochlorin chelatase n=1 Tax=Enterococcus asini TaxID=57732 RepID=UPI00288E6533|nr:CbiX/SirB N-terminal domain-containing protein [Enterococcus asini]MDT2757900.1 CbiX/SirB N-terminal domain-containing protein [Enterococcus asini]
MKTALLFVLHGRTEKIAAYNLETIYSLQKETSLTSSYGFLEGNQATLEMAATDLVKQGVKKLIVIPLLLFPATHALVDLPDRLKACLPSEVTFEVLETIGTTQTMFAGLKEKIQAAPTRGKLMIIAHGTPHYSEPLAMLKEICHKLEVECQRPIIWGNYVGPDNYLQVAAKEREPLVVLPFFLTVGHIVKKITKELTTAHLEGVVFLPTFQDSDTLYLALKERMEEAGCIQS